MLRGVDLEKGVMQDDALKALQRWESEGTSAILGTTKTVLISQANDPAIAAVDVTPGTKSSDRFANLLK
jgi:hypothetical protein